MGETVLDRIKQARREAGLDDNQTAIGRDLGINQSAVAKWRIPGKGPKLANALEIALQCNVNVEWLYTGRGPKRPSDLKTRNGQDVHAFLESLDEEILKEVVQFAEFRAKTET